MLTVFYNCLQRPLKLTGGASNLPGPEWQVSHQNLTDLDGWKRAPTWQWLGQPVAQWRPDSMLPTYHFQSFVLKTMQKPNSDSEISVLTNSVVLSYAQHSFKLMQRSSRMGQKRSNSSLNTHAQLLLIFNVKTSTGDETPLFQYLTQSDL